MEIRAILEEMTADYSNKHETHTIQITHRHTHTQINKEIATIKDYQQVPLR